MTQSSNGSTANRNNDAAVSRALRGAAAAGKVRRMSAAEISGNARRKFPYREALVTGASRGLGRAFALALLAEGVRVHGTSRDGSRLPEGVIPHALDLADATSVEALVEQLQREAPGLDLLVNNAGAGVWCPVAELPAPEIAAQFTILLAGPIRLCRAFFSKFAARKHGGIVNVASLAGAFPIPYMSLYCAGKAGLSAFTRTLMLEAAGSGVAVLDFQPGDYCTDFNNNMRKPERACADALGDAARETRAWDCCEVHLKAGPPPEHAARALVRALARHRTQTVASGTFFQATLGPLLARILPQIIVQKFLEKYYQI